MFRQSIIAISIFELLFLFVHKFDMAVLLEPRNIIFNVLFLFWFGMEASRVRLGHKDQSTTYGVLSRAFLIVSFMAVIVGIFDSAGHIKYLNDIKLPTFVFYIGAFLLIVGIYIRHVTIKQLGKFFVTKIQTLDDHELIKSGIYSVLRHPSYTGLIIGFIGAILLLESGVALIVFIIIGIPAYIYRIKVEEKALISYFGENYIEYKRTTSAIIPYLY